MTDDSDHDPWADDPPQPDFDDHGPPPDDHDCPPEFRLLRPGVRPALDDPTDRPVTERGTDLFHRWTTAELLAADREFRWRVRGLLVHPTYGMLGGEQKTLKTYVSIFLDIAVATGTKLFDQFPIDMPGPVVAYVGEGGRIPYTRRLERIAHAMGVNLIDAPLFPSFDIAPVGSLIFEESLLRDLSELQPALVHIDPWYAYHGASTEAKNLLAEGTHLSGLSAPIIDHGASLLVNHHFNQTGGGKGISRLSMAGAQEWVDSWLLLGHRQDPDVANGKFWLSLEIGSRQWGGSSWELDLDVGRFDVDLGEYEGDIGWELRRSSSGAAHDRAVARQKILLAVEAAPGECDKETLAKLAGMNLQQARNLVTSMSDAGDIRTDLVPVERKNGRTDKVWRYFPAHPDPDFDPGDF